MHKFWAMNSSIARFFVGTRVVAATAAALMAATSCQVLETPQETVPEPTGPKPPQIVEPVHTPVGTVLAVGGNNEYVVIRLNPGATAEIGERLSVMFAGTETAVLKVAPQRTDDLVTADVEIGSPAKDSEVVRIETPSVGGDTGAVAPTETPAPIDGAAPATDGSVPPPVL